MNLPRNIVANRSGIQQGLLNWFAKKKRDFPWRHTVDPFEILLAEKLLQQTKARDTVTAVFKSLLAEYPTAVALMDADVNSLRIIIKPLGLAYRASELKLMATELVEKHNGKVPSDLNELLQLTGVGDYCARAVLSFGYGQRIPIVDTNVARFLHRLCGIQEPLPANPARKRHLRDLASALLPEDEVIDFNLAVLDLCALVCRSGKPLCSECPLIEYCAYGQAQSDATETP